MTIFSTYYCSSPLFSQRPGHVAALAAPVSSHRRARCNRATWSSAAGAAAWNAAGNGGVEGCRANGKYLSWVPWVGRLHKVVPQFVNANLWLISPINLGFINGGYIELVHGYKHNLGGTTLHQQYIRNTVDGLEIQTKVENGGTLFPLFLGCQPSKMVLFFLHPQFHGSEMIWAYHGN